LARSGAGFTAPARTTAPARRDDMRAHPRRNEGCGRRT
jgi:hypothetical protein